MRSWKLMINREIIKRYDEYQYFHYVIAYHVAPTLEGVKPSNLVDFKDGDKKLKARWEKHGRFFKKLNHLELYSDEKSCLVLFYNKDMLSDIILNGKCFEYLVSIGYPHSKSIDELLIHLRNRFKDEFPHEIGLFLGYAFEDVVSFTEYPSERGSFVGYWKVYHDVENAKRCFNLYDEATFKICNLLNSGVKPHILLYA